MPESVTTLRAWIGSVIRWFLPIYHGGAIREAPNPCDLFDYLRDLNSRIKILEDKCKTLNQ